MTALHFLMVTYLFSMHPMHVAYTNIEINVEKNNIVVSHKLHKADFTLLFYHLFEQSIEPETDKDFNTHEKDLIKRYISNRFILVCDNDTLKGDYKGRKMDDESLWLDYSYEIKKKHSSRLEIINLLMIDLYMDQTNLVIVKNGANESGLSFNWDKPHSVIFIND